MREETMTNICTAEYIWIDGTEPVPYMRSKTKILHLPDKFSINDIPDWQFDGSSTKQATGDRSDCILHPVNYVTDPMEDGGDILVMCEVFSEKDVPHPSNTRARLRATLEKIDDIHNPMFGFEQEYTLFDGNVPLGWPDKGNPGPQGPFYCGVGADNCFGREIANKHREACLQAGILYYGMNAEVMPGQWEFQIGYRGNKQEDAGPLNVSDHTWLGRWLLYRISEDYDVTVSYDNKPVKGDWNGAGMHTNFSYRAMREVETGRDEIAKSIEKLSATHAEHIKGYGYNLHERLTGLHETSAIHEFSAGTSDRGRSVRVPKQVNERGYGYIEDRRPGANADPYIVAELILRSVLVSK